MTVKQNSNGEWQVVGHGGKVLATLPTNEDAWCRIDGQRR
jgi:hypothetical protein